MYCTLLHETKRLLQKLEIMNHWEKLIDTNGNYVNKFELYDKIKFLIYFHFTKFEH